MCVYAQLGWFTRGAILSILGMRSKMLTQNLPLKTRDFGNAVLTRSVGNSLCV